MWLDSFRYHFYLCTQSSIAATEVRTLRPPQQRDEMYA
jgi:hypothetical protein